MKGYLTYFKTQIIMGLQYKVSALAGLITQIFWGFLSAFIYTSFYKYASVENFNIESLMSYVWLNQALFSLIYLNIKDAEMMNAIKKGTVAYELLRPYDLYSWWYVKLLSCRYAKVIMRCIPIILLALLLPKPYNLSAPHTLQALVLSGITILLGSLVITGINMLVNILTFFTMQDRGLTGIIYNIGSLLSGFVLPLPLLPNKLVNLTEYLPFRLIGDLPFRIYSGSISYEYAFKSIVLQIIWIIILVISGRSLLKKVLKRVSIQGG